ncbi:M24 family metallopeptidase [Roseovarius mucosus]|uniref:M24 family metallopeptidase n=1 Tax=Roseovarius mucosus TaxID=215743 RepID=UPI003F718C06
MTAVVTQGQESVFPSEEFRSRQARARSALADAGIDLFIVTGPENIFWLTGQQTPGYYTYQALLLPVDGEPAFIVRQLEYNNLIANSFLSDIHPYADNADPVTVTVDTVQALGWTGKRIAIDERGWFLPVAIYKALLAAFGELGNGAGLIERLRMVKSAAEIAKIEAAAHYVDAGMTAGMSAIRAGATENDVVAAMMSAAIAAGSEYLGMEPLMASGPRCGIPHGTWRRRVIETGDPVFLEMAACHDRYHAALMRSAWIGTPDSTAARMMDCCDEALGAALDALRPGNTCEQVHDACQSVIDRHGFTENFRKRTGYAIGVSFAPDWGEGNVLSLYSGVRNVLEPGMVFHIPPALRIYGKFTVGVSETAVVTESGCRTFSNMPRGLRLM